MREVDYMLRAIDRRMHNEFVGQAALHGIKLPARYNKEKAVEQAKLEESEFDATAVDAALNAAKGRVQSRYGKR